MYEWDWSRDTQPDRTSRALLLAVLAFAAVVFLSLFMFGGCAGPQRAAKAPCLSEGPPPLHKFGVLANGPVPDELQEGGAKAEFLVVDSASWRLFLITENELHKWADDAYSKCGPAPAKK